MSTSHVTSTLTTSDADLHDIYDVLRFQQPRRGPPPTNSPSTASIPVRGATQEQSTSPIPLTIPARSCPERSLSSSPPSQVAQMWPLIEHAVRMLVLAWKLRRRIKSFGNFYCSTGPIKFRITEKGPIQTMYYCSATSFCSSMDREVFWKVDARSGPKKTRRSYAIIWLNLWPMVVNRWHSV